MSIYDLRTTRGQEEAVLAHIREYGGFTIYWGTEYPKRAAAIERLIDSGRIVRGDDKFPWCAFILQSDGQCA